jgi:hypothetical protein
MAVSSIAVGKSAAVWVESQKDYCRRALILIRNPIGRKLLGNGTMQKRTEITIETERYLVVSHRHDNGSLWCNHCSTNLPVLTVDEAATATSRTPLVIFRLAEAGRLHFAVTPEGRHFICPQSLALERAEDAVENA